MDKIAVIDFGGQYSHLIANRIRRLGVYSEIVLPDADLELFSKYCGIILSGSPYSVLDPDSPSLYINILSLNIPILGLCYGHQLIAHLLGGTLSRGDKREYGIADMTIVQYSPLFKGLTEEQQIWMSHGDSVATLPDGFNILGFTTDCLYAAVENTSEKIYGLQFHPEVSDTPGGNTILNNFIEICKCSKNWNSNSFSKEIIQDIRRKCNNRKVILLVSGGVDSTVAFTLLNNALGVDRVLGLHIDNGFMRYEESDDVISYLKNNGYNNIYVFNAAPDFFNALQGVVNPEEKRNIIGNQFIKAKESAQSKLDINVDKWLLAQGTIYPDTIESAGTKHADKIKTHHNRVDSILELLENGLVIEPLAQLYKDEVRQLGESLGIPHELLWRHPFPGPGLGVRALCSNGIEEPIDINESKKVAQIADSAGFKSYILPVKSVGVQGDSRTYTNPVLITGKREWSLLEVISTKITNSIKNINRVVYGISIQENPEYTLIEAYLTEERLDKLREIDHLVNSIIRQTGEYELIWQMPVVLLPLVNISRNECVVLRPIASQEAMTARFFPLRDDTFQRIIEGARSIEGVGDLFFDITHKPPATIEWE